MAALERQFAESKMEMMSRLQHEFDVELRRTRQGGVRSTASTSSGDEASTRRVKVGTSPSTHCRCANAEAAACYSTRTDCREVSDHTCDDTRRGS